MGSIEPLPSIFDTIHPINLIFGTYNELPLYFQLSKTTWCLIGFHGNHDYINDVTTELNTENGEKTAFSDWNLQNC